MSNILNNIFYQGVANPHKPSIMRYFNVYKENSLLFWELTQGQLAILDEEDFDLVNNYIWRAQKDTWPNSYYAIGGSGTNTIGMHRLIAGIPIGVEVDHKDLNPLNNSKVNLRLATSKQQMLNHKRNGNNSGTFTSSYRGVTLVENGKYRVRVQDINNKQKSLGRFINEISAAEAWDDFMYEEYKNDYPLKNINQYRVSGEPTLNFIPFNFPIRLGL